MPMVNEAIDALADRFFEHRCATMYLEAVHHGHREIGDIASAHADQINTFCQRVLQSLSELSLALQSAGTDK
jgi:type IV secretory pathway ATPase VirB11/archaellum biosynthesis ATPase